MANWRRVLGQIASNVEDQFEVLMSQLTERLGGDYPLKIVAYRGYGTAEKLYLKGRVLEDKDIRPAGDQDSAWDNLVNMYKRFASSEIPGARVVARFQDIEQEVIADAEGFFEVWIEPAQPLATNSLWHQIELELRYPQPAGDPPVRAVGEVLVPPPSAQFGVISDIRAGLDCAGGVS